MRAPTSVFHATRIEQHVTKPVTYKPRILIADDQADVLTALRLLLKSNGFESASARSPSEVRSWLSKENFDGVLLDMNYTRDTTSGQEGLDLVETIRKSWPRMPVIVLTAWGTIELAVEAVRRGACDFLPKPWDNGRLLAALRAQIGAGRADSDTTWARAAATSGVRPPKSLLVARSNAMRAVVELVERVALSTSNVLITGEHGTGKGVVAHEIHARSRRSAKPLLTVNVAALSEGLFESELFGHVVGAYTDARGARSGRFELAHGGTLFLDEIGNLPFNLQAKLLRAIESGEFERVGSSETLRVDVRVLAATNADLRAKIRDGSFREDLYYRLNTVEIRLPPLRERRDDIVPLAEHFLARHSASYGHSRLSFSPDALDALRANSWPGNVRQLEHAIERAVLLARDEAIHAADLDTADHGAPDATTEGMTLEEVERALIRRALARAGGKVTEAAAALGLSRSALYRRLVKYGWDRDESTAAN